MIVLQFMMLFNSKNVKSKHIWRTFHHTSKQRKARLGCTNPTLETFYNIGRSFKRNSLFTFLFLVPTLGHQVIHHINPSSAKLEYTAPTADIIRWSNNFISIIFAPSLILFVSSTSAFEDLMFPQGWL